jgi:hypothetical protein
MIAVCLYNVKSMYKLEDVLIADDVLLCRSTDLYEKYLLKLTQLALGNPSLS